MEAPKLTSKPTDIFTVTVRARKSMGKETEFLTYYLPLIKEVRESLGGVQKGEVLTLGVLKRVRPPEEVRKV
jgi:hypothetical protein